MEELTIKDVTRICGVGTSTVPCIINDYPDINPGTKQKVFEGKLMIKESKAGFGPV